jgi:hypothetical protein
VTPTKGQDLLVDALADVADRPGLTCDLVGPLGRAPVHVADVRAMITANGLDSRIRMPGRSSARRWPPRSRPPTCSCCPRAPRPTGWS